MKLPYYLVGTLVFLVCDCIPSSECTCLLPSTFTGSWWDSRTNGVITISSLQVTAGWELAFYTGQYSTYTCIYSDSNHWVFRSDQILQTTFGIQYYAVFCLQFTKVTDNSYYYYLMSDKEPVMSFERVFVVDLDTESTYTMSSNYCSPYYSGPDGREYNVLVKANMQSTIHTTDWPDPLLGKFQYTVNNGTSTSCGAGSVWDGCYFNNVIDRTTVKLNYTQCTTQLMGSTNGLLYHVASVKYGSIYYTILINADGTDTKFTCIAVSQSGNSRFVSTNPGGCAEGQTSTSRTSEPKSLLITMTAYETCLTTTTTSTTASPTTVVSSIQTTTDGQRSYNGAERTCVKKELFLVMLMIGYSISNPTK